MRNNDEIKNTCKEIIECFYNNENVKTYFKLRKQIDEHAELSKKYKLVIQLRNKAATLSGNEKISLFQQANKIYNEYINHPLIHNYKHYEEIVQEMTDKIVNIMDF